RVVAIPSPATPARNPVRGLAARALRGLRRPARDSAPAPYEPRELRVEFAILAGFFAVAAALALTLPRAGFDAVTTLVLGVLVGGWRGVGSAAAVARPSPVRLGLVPILVLVPPAYIPLVVAAAHAMRALASAARGARPPMTVVLAVGDAWYVIGPAL